MSSKGGTNYVVQAANSLGGTNTFTDLSGIIALPGVGALTNQATRFYRIRTN